ncbi:MAG TPA: leucine efflux protein LeuE [Rhodocyclaceae bacterium]
MFGVTDITTYIIGVVITVLLPGPNSLFVLSAASRQGVAMGYRAACGVFVGDLVLMILTAAGMASLLHSHPGLFNAVKMLGAAYLAWLGVGMLRAALAGWRRDVQVLAADRPVQGAGRPFTRALTISLLNPKAILFFMAFFVQFVDPTYAYPALSFAILGTIVQIASFVYLSTLIFAGHRLAAAFRARRRLAAGATGGVGTLFLTFSARLATATAG